MVVPRLEGVGRLPLEVLRVAGELVPDAGQHDLPVGHCQQAHDAGKDDRRPGDPPAGHAGSEERRQLVVTLEPGEREHRAGQGDHRARRVEEGDQPVAVVGAEHPGETTGLRGVRDELLHVRESIDHERQAREADEDDQERVELGTGDVAVDEHGRLTLRAGGRRWKAADRDRAAAGGGGG